MKRLSLYILTAMIALLGTGTSHAQDRAQWMNEIRQYKRSYFAKELDLTREQQNKFFPLYEEMEEQTGKLEEETRMLEKRVADAPDASNLEYEKATEAIYESKVKQAELEQSYLEKFSQVLSPKQLFELKGVERRFSRDMVKQYNRLRSKK